MSQFPLRIYQHCQHHHNHPFLFFMQNYPYQCENLKSRFFNSVKFVWSIFKEMQLTSLLPLALNFFTVSVLRVNFQWKSSIVCMANYPSYRGIRLSLVCPIEFFLWERNLSSARVYEIIRLRELSTLWDARLKRFHCESFYYISNRYSYEKWHQPYNIHIVCEITKLFTKCDKW